MGRRVGSDVGRGVGPDVGVGRRVGCGENGEDIVIRKDIVSEELLISDMVIPDRKTPPLYVSVFGYDPRPG